MKKAGSTGVQDFRKLWEGYFLQRVVMDEGRKGLVCALNWDTLQLGQPADGSSYQVAWWSDEQGRYAIEQCEACDSKKLAAMATEDFDDLPAPATNDPLTMLLVKPLYQANFKMTEQEYANRLQKAGKEYARLGALSAAEARRVKELIAARKQQKPQQQQQQQQQEAEEAEEEGAAAPAKGKKQSAGKAKQERGSAKQTASKVPKGEAAKAGKAAAAGPSKAAATAAGAKKKAPASPAPAPAKQSAGKKTAAGKSTPSKETVAATAPSTKRKAGTAAATAPASAAKKTRK